MKFIKKIIQKIKKKIQAIAARIAGKPLPPSFANIFILKNNKEVYHIESTSSDITDGVCEIIKFFSKYDNYKIIYNYPEKDIYIYFTVKKGEDVAPEDSEKKSK